MILYCNQFFKCGVLVKTQAGQEGGEEVPNSQFISSTIGYLHNHE